MHSQTLEFGALTISCKLERRTGNQKHTKNHRLSILNWGFVSFCIAVASSKVAIEFKKNRTCDYLDWYYEPLEWENKQGWSPLRPHRQLSQMSFPLVFHCFCLLTSLDVLCKAHRTTHLLASPLTAGGSQILWAFLLLCTKCNFWLKYSCFKNMLFQERLCTFCGLMTKGAFADKSLIEA